MQRRLSHLKDVSSLSSSSSSESALLLVPLTLLAAREVAGELGFELAGEGTLERALRDVVLPLSRACRRKSCIVECKCSRYSKCKRSYMSVSRVVVRQAGIWMLFEIE